MNNNLVSSILQSGGNPAQTVMNMLQQQNNPLANNLLQLAQSGDKAGLEQVARNICQQRGADFDKEFSAFRKQFGL